MKRIKTISIFLLLFSSSTFAQQLDLSLIPYRQGNLWGYAYADKSIAIAPIFQNAKWFSYGYAAVEKGNRYGYINKQGFLVIPYKFYDAKAFVKGYFDSDEKHSAGGKVMQNEDSVLFAGAVIKLNGIERCIDTKGRVMTKCPAINENRPDNNQPILTVTNQIVYSLKSDANIFDKLVDDYHLPNNNNTYYIGLKNNKYGVINNTFDIIVPFEYDSIKRVNLNETVYLQVQKNGMTGLYTGTGDIFLQANKTRLSYATPTKETVYFIESQNGIARLRDVNNQDLINADYSDIAYDENGGFILTSSDNYKGYYFLDKKIIKPKYLEVRLVRGGNFLLVKTVTGKAGYVNADGVEYFTE
ncbi:MAG: WG repeat-containing protein [Chitinophagaceae bacterium]|nr:WG repeat-containing protein [Chitinophagaceae bacterium]